MGIKNAKTKYVFLNNPDLVKSQLEDIKKTLKNIKSETPSTDKVSTILSYYL